LLTPMVPGVDLFLGRRDLQQSNAWHRSAELRG